MYSCIDISIGTRLGSDILLYLERAHNYTCIYFKFRIIYLLSITF